MRQRVVSPDEWTKARVALLAHEKELTRLRDAISRQRRELPWVRIDKDYSFEGSRGTQTLSDLFEGRLLQPSLQPGSNMKWYTRSWLLLVPGRQLRWD